jgi:hypothetical protein
MPPNSNCAEQPQAIVPLPSVAIETLPATGSGLPGLTGIATPSTTSAAAYTGTGLPPLSDCVAISAVVVLSTSTGTVIGHPLPRQADARSACHDGRLGAPGFRSQSALQGRLHTPGSVAILSEITPVVNYINITLGNCSIVGALGHPTSPYVQLHMIDGACANRVVRLAEAPIHWGA